MSRHRDNAPIGHTCPEIDNVIGMLDAVADRIDALNEKIDCKALGDIFNDFWEQAKYLRSLFNGRNSELEKLRSANDLLRAWGNEEHNRANDAEEE
ncbi:hypothetical protein [Burkholderia mayonis]|uniref:hypothetical protein n=1 Tax=Burkholderia mayonis TaxID=1385591 RepID=UPI000AE2B066|nr:hypothetical protein [Burkholderia mayonis]